MVPTSRVYTQTQNNMGQAKRRGSFEERKEQAITRKREASDESYAKWLASHPPESDRPPVRMRNPMMSSALMIAAMSAAMAPSMFKHHR